MVGLPIKREVKDDSLALRVDLVAANRQVEDAIDIFVEVWIVLWSRGQVSVSVRLPIDGLSVNVLGKAHVSAVTNLWLAIKYHPFVGYTVIGDEFE